MATTLFQRLASRGVLLPNGQIVRGDLGNHVSTAVHGKSIAPTTSHQAVSTLKEEQLVKANGSLDDVMRHRPALDPLPLDAPVDTSPMERSAASSRSRKGGGGAANRCNAKASKENRKIQHRSADPPAACGSTPESVLIDPCQRVLALAEDEMQRRASQANGNVEAPTSSVDATVHHRTDMRSPELDRCGTRQRAQKKKRAAVHKFAKSALSPAMKKHRSSSFAEPLAPTTPKTERVRALRRTMSSPQSLSFSSSTEMCTLCCDDVPSSRAVRLRCQHGWYCVDCMERHVEARLDNGTVLQSCPECQLEVAERDLKRIISQSLLDRLLARSLEQAVAATEDLRPCPTPNCLMRVALDAEDSGQFKCPECEKECCLRCGAQPYHRRLTCEQHAERCKKGRKDSLQQWMEETGTKQCPSCKMGVTKDDLENQNTQISECHKMLCRNCGTRFCYQCLAVLTAQFTCGCTIDEHGFIDPFTGKYVRHLKTGRRNKRGA